MYIKCLHYIQYNCGRCAPKKGTQRRRSSHLWPTQQLETPQRVSSDSLGVGADRDRAQKRARSPAMSPGSAKALSGNANVILDVFDEIFDVEGAP